MTIRWLPRACLLRAAVVVQNRVAHNIRVVNLSLVSSLPEPSQVSPLAAAVELTWPCTTPSSGAGIAPGCARRKVRPWPPPSPEAECWIYARTQPSSLTARSPKPTAHQGPASRPQPTASVSRRNLAWRDNCPERAGRHLRSRSNLNQRSDRAHRWHPVWHVCRPAVRRRGYLDNPPQRLLDCEREVGIVCL